MPQKVKTLMRTVQPPVFGMARLSFSWLALGRLDSCAPGRPRSDHRRQCARPAGLHGLVLFSSSKTTMAQGFAELERCLVELNARIRTEKLLIATSSDCQVCTFPNLERTFQREVELDCVRLRIVPTMRRRLAR